MENITRPCSSSVREERKKELTPLRAEVIDRLRDKTKRQGVSP